MSVHEFKRVEVRKGAFELIDRQLYESLGLFLTGEDASEYARSVNLKSWEIWQSSHLVEIAVR